MKPRTKTLIIAGLFTGVLGAAAVIGYDAAQAHRGGGSDGWLRTHHDRGDGHFGPGRHHGMGRVPGILESFDGDGDGKLSQSEIDGTRQARLAEYDRDGNGTLDLQEYQALWLDAMRERMVRGFQRHDADGDGAMTPEEFGRRFSHLVLRFDRNGDGVLDRSDWEMRRHDMRRDDDGNR